MHRFLCTLLLPTVVAVVGLAAAPINAESTDILPLSEVERGQKGHGFSVFSGSSPERFEVEVLGVWRDVEPDTSYILAMAKSNANRLSDNARRFWKAR